MVNDTNSELMSEEAGAKPKRTAAAWKEWLLALVFFASVGWVSLWTILATHTKFQQTVLDPDMSSAYFEQKQEGIRVFTYLGVFYLWLGVVSYVALMHGVRLPKPTARMVRTYQIPRTHFRFSILEAGAFFFFCAVLLATFLARVFNRFEFGYWPPERYCYEVAKTFGKTAALILLVLFFPVSKNCFWWDILNFQFERAVRIHRILAWMLVWIVVIHATTAVTSLIMVGQFRSCMLPNENCEKPGGWGTWDGLETSRTFTYGWVAFLVAMPLAITSLPWFRRNKFEWFYYTHFLFIPFVIVLHLHYYNLIYYLAPGLSAYVLDKVVWFCATRRKTRIVDLSSPAPGFCRLTIAVDRRYKFEPGAWVQLKIPAISVLEWHPMSVASAPGHSTIMIDVKVLGDWTRKLAQLATRFDSSRPSHTCVFVDMFHGSSHSMLQGYLNHAAVLMFAGGIGITPMMSAMRHLIENSTKYPNIRRVVLVWCCKKKSVVELYRNELASFQSLGRTASGCEIQVIVHVTLSEKENDRDYTSVNVDDSSKSHHEAANVNKQGPFMQHVMGYRHQLILTIFTGGGYLLGIFLANFFAHDREWRSEAVSILQLMLALFCSGTLVTFAMAPSFFRPNAKWKRHSISSASPSGLEKDVEMPQSKQQLPAPITVSDSEELNVIFGCRPIVFNIINEMKTFCEGNGISSVGVSVCGPEQLVQTVINASRKKSSPTLEFVVDEETFDW